MKKVIIEHLRTFSEGREGRHTTSNPSFDGKVYYYTLDELKDEIDSASNAYTSKEKRIEFLESLDVEELERLKLSQELRELKATRLSDVYTGDGLYEFILYSVGKGKWAFGGKQSSVGNKRAPGDSNVSQGGKTLYLYVMGERGILHPEYDLLGDSTPGKPHSPMAIANLKVLTFMGNKIKDFIDNSLGYDDGKAAQISKDNMSDVAARKKVKKDFEMKLGRRVKHSEWERYLKTGEEPGTKPVSEPVSEPTTSSKESDKDKLQKRMELLYKIKSARKIKDKEERKNAMADYRNQIVNLEL